MVSESYPADLSDMQSGKSSWLERDGVDAKSDDSYERLSARLKRGVSTSLSRARWQPSTGGEGLLKLVSVKTEQANWLGLQNGYWFHTLLAVRGRALPLACFLLYSTYCAAVVAAIVLFVDDYKVALAAYDFRDLVTATGAALFFLLNFRTQASYQRWWEGRTLWGDTCATCVDLVSICFSTLADAPRVARIAAWSQAHAVCSKNVLRGEKDLTELEGILPASDVADLAHAFDPPLYCLNQIRHLINELMHSTSYKNAKYPNDRVFHHDRVKDVESELGNLVSSYYGCQRIATTPMPFSYVVHLRSFLVLWLLVLPFAFVVALDWWTIVACAVIGYQLLGFDTLSIEIEQPFGRDYNDLPLDSLTDGIAAVLEQGLLAQRHLAADADACPDDKGGCWESARPALCHGVAAESTIVDRCHVLPVLARAGDTKGLAHHSAAPGECDLDKNGRSECLV